MRQSKWAPSISPHDIDQSVYLVLDDFGKHGRASRWGRTYSGPRALEEPASAAMNQAKGCVWVMGAGRRTGPNRGAFVQNSIGGQPGKKRPASWRDIPPSRDGAV